MALTKYSLRIFGLNSFYLKNVGSTTKLCSVFYRTKADSKNDQSPIIPNRYAVNKLQELFDIRKSLAANIILENKQMSKVAVRHIVKVFKSCIDVGVKKEDLLKHAEVLTASGVNEKLKMLKQLPHELSNTFPLLVHSEQLLRDFIIQEKTEKRIPYLSKLLDLKVGEVCAFLSKRPFLLKLNLQHIKESCNILERFGITKEEICKDLWVLKYSLKNVQAKMEFVHANKIDNPKTWMVRVPILTLENSIRRRSDNQSILGQNSFIEYISQKLQCSHEHAKYMISKQPAIQNKSLKKINKMIDFLLSEGFTTQHICRSPKILLHSVDTLRARLKLIEEKGTKLFSLSVCTKSKKQFTQFLESINSDKNKKNVSSVSAQ